MRDMGELMAELGAEVSSLQAAKMVVHSHVKRLVEIKEELHGLGIDVAIKELEAEAPAVIEDAPDGSVALSGPEIPAPSVTRGPDPDPGTEEFRELSEAELAHQVSLRGGKVDNRTASAIQEEANAGVVEDPAKVVADVSVGFMGAYEAGMAEAGEKAKRNPIMPPGWQGFSN